MEEEKFKELFVKYAQELLSVDVQEKQGQYGEKWVEISLLLDNEAINTVYLDLPRLWNM